MQQLAPGPSQRGCPSYGLVSLWDMIRIQLEHYLTLGKNIATLRRVLEEQDNFGAMAVVGGQKLSPSAATVAVIGQLRDACEALGLEVSTRTIDATMKSFSGPSQIEVLLNVVQSEMSSRLFLHVPHDRAKFWETDIHLGEKARSVFGVAASEIRASGTAYACGLWNASVFHSMRAAEEGLIAICEDLEIKRSGAESWGPLIERIESKLEVITKLPKASEEKRNFLQPLSELVVDLRLFKDAWRNQNSHNIVAYNDGHALSIMHAVCRVLEALALRPKQDEQPS